MTTRFSIQKIEFLDKPNLTLKALVSVQITFENINSESGCASVTIHQVAIHDSPGIPPYILLPAKTFRDPSGSLQFLTTVGLPSSVMSGLALTILSRYKVLKEEREKSLVEGPEVYPLHPKRLNNKGGNAKKTTP
jgi:hypothetical protein